MYSLILIIARTLKALNLLLKQSLLGIVIFYTQKTPKRGEHSWDQGIISLEAIFSRFAWFWFNSIFRILRPGESTVTMFDVVQEFFTDLWDNWFGERSSSNWNYLRILKKRSLQQKQVNKRDIVLPSFGIAGEIVNDMANSAINAATVWKYQ